MPWRTNDGLMRYFLSTGFGTEIIKGGSGSRVILARADLLVPPNRTRDHSAGPTRVGITGPFRFVHACIAADGLALARMTGPVRDADL